MQINYLQPVSAQTPIYQIQIPARGDEPVNLDKTETKHEPIEKYVQYAKEHGLMALIDKFPEFKAEEIRADMLERLGLTEESFQALPAEQQERINEMIKEKVELELYGHIKEKVGGMASLMQSSVRIYA